MGFPLMGFLLMGFPLMGFPLMGFPLVGFLLTTFPGPGNPSPQRARSLEEAVPFRTFSRAHLMYREGKNESEKVHRGG